MTNEGKFQKKSQNFLGLQPRSVTNKGVFLLIWITDSQNTHFFGACGGPDHKKLYFRTFQLDPRIFQFTNISEAFRIDTDALCSSRKVNMNCLGAQELYWIQIFGACGRPDHKKLYFQTFQIDPPHFPLYKYFRSFQHWYGRVMLLVKG